MFIPLHREICHLICSSYIPPLNAVSLFYCDGETGFGHKPLIGLRCLFLLKYICLEIMCYFYLGHSLNRKRIFMHCRPQYEWSEVKHMYFLAIFNLYHRSRLSCHIHMLFTKDLNVPFLRFGKGLLL